MQKTLSDFLGWAVAIILLLVAYTFGKNDIRSGAIGGVVLLVAWMYFWNRPRSSNIASTDCTSETSQGLTEPTTRKMNFDWFNIIAWGLWLVAICIGAGIFGKSGYQSYVFDACAVLGLAIIAIRHHWHLHNSN
ncbi:MAG TPA: hypothetical protein VHX43_06495 [Xanthobacteraceae bacterium]|jgi:hypothetical protein|nr:hypothetical protein [Xanthobacteraceae bacterium]